MNILLVEDDAIAAIAAEELLSEKFGCEVDTAKTGQAAVQFAQAKRYELIFMDIGLPDISGFETTRQIHAHENSKNQNTSIIALTGNTNTDMKAKCVEAGMIEVLEKPLTGTKVSSIFATMSS